jgi:hypothetical protein
VKHGNVILFQVVQFQPSCTKVTKCIETSKSANSSSVKESCFEPRGFVQEAFFKRKEKGIIDFVPYHVCKQMLEHKALLEKS